MAKTIGASLAFGNDNVSDIGASASGRPRDLWVARNATLAGDLKANNAALSGNVTGAIVDAGGQVYNVKSAPFGAKGDGRILSSLSTTASSATVTSSSAMFLSSDVGKSIAINGAAGSGNTLYTTIATFVSSTQITITTVATAAVTGVGGTCGTDDGPAIRAALSALAASPSQSGVIFFPPGSYYLATYDQAFSEPFKSRILVATGGNANGPATYGFLGYGATLLTSLNQNTGDWDSCTLMLNGYHVNSWIQGLTFTNMHDLTVGTTTAVFLNGGSGNTVNKTEIRGCAFRNFSQAVLLTGCSATKILNNNWTYDLGHDSGQNTTGPNVGIRASTTMNGQVFDLLIDGNYWNGCALSGFPTNASQKVCMDGFYYGWSYGLTITNNTIVNHGVEGIAVWEFYSPFSLLTTLAADYTSGDGVITTDVNPPLGNVDDQYPCRIKLVDGTNMSIFQATKINSGPPTVVTVGSPVEGTSDASYAAGTVVLIFPNVTTLITGNRIDDLQPYGSTRPYGAYAIRSDASNVMISNNCLTNVSQGILCRPGYQTGAGGNRGTDIRVIDNAISMAGAPRQSNFAISVQNSDRVKIQGNDVVWPSYSPTNGRATGVSLYKCTSVVAERNAIKSLVKSGGNGLAGFSFQASSDVTLTKNTTENCDYGLYLVDASTALVTSHTWTNNTATVYGSTGKLTVRRHVTTYTPTATGFYRVAQFNGSAAGSLLIKGDNGVNSTDAKLEFAYISYSDRGSISITRNAAVSGGVINQARITGDTSGNIYLDVYVRAGNAPITLTLITNDDRSMLLFDQWTTPGFVADGTNTSLVSLDFGQTSSHLFGSTPQIIKTAIYAVQTHDSLLWIDATSGNIDVTVPAVSGVLPYHRFGFKRVDSTSNTVRIISSYSATQQAFDKKSQVYYLAPEEEIHVTSDGSNNYWLSYQAFGYNSVRPNQVGGGLQTSQVATPAAPTVTPTGGTDSTTYTYYVVAVDASGRKTLPSPATTITNGVATLSGTTYNAVSWNYVQGAVSYDVLRGDTGHSIALGRTANFVNDTGLTASTYTPAAANTTGDISIGGTASVQGLSSSISTQTGGYPVTLGDSTLLGNASSGSVTFTLPSAVGITGRQFTFKKIDSSANAVVLNTTASQTIDGAASQSITSQWGVIRVQSNGTNWYVV